MGNPVPRAAETSGRLSSVAAVVAAASFLAGVNQSSVGVALPAISAHFRADPVASNWVLLAYMLALTGLVVVCGRLADVFGSKLIFIWGIWLFVLSSAALGGAPNIEVLLGLRVIQGCAAAMMFATGAAIIVQTMPAASLGRGMGVYFATNSVAQLLGPVLGGFVSQSLGWSWLFWMNVPAAVITMVLAHRVLPAQNPPGRGHPIDLSGALLGLALLGSLLTGLNVGGPRGWSDPLVLCCLLSSPVFGVLFLLREKHAHYPILDLTLFRDRVFTWGNLTGALNNAVRFAVVLLLALLYQTLHADGPGLASVIVTPVSAGTLVGTLTYRWCEYRLSHVTLGFLGATVTTAGVLTVIPTVGAESHRWFATIGGALVGLGSGTLVTANGTTIMAAAPRRRLGAVSGVRVLLQLVGITLGTALALATAASPLHPADQAAFYSGTSGSISAGGLALLPHGYYAAFSVLALLSLASAITTLRSRPRSNTDPPMREPGPPGMATGRSNRKKDPHAARETN